VLGSLWSFALAAAALSASVLFEGARRPLRGVTPPPNIPSLSAHDCSTCHDAIYKQWLASRHAQSFTNRIFVASFRREPLSWCVYCHAPLPEQAKALAGARHIRVRALPLVDEGVNCAVCHIRNGAILRARAPSAAALRAHRMRVVPSLATSEFCGGCHQFNVPRPGLPVRYTAEPMQDTLAEWRRTTRNKECQDCHMAGGGHAFPGGHDVALLRNTLRVHITPKNDRLQIELEANGAGHRVPTGDPFRRLQLQLLSEEQAATPLGTYSFGRRFRNPPHGDKDTWVLAQDLSIPPPTQGTTAVRSFTAKAMGAKYWRLLFSYPAPSSRADLQGDDIAVEVLRGAVPQPIREAPTPTALPPGRPAPSRP
jgi:hypothetical protein